jgi:hypothetical protein
LRRLDKGSPKSDAANARCADTAIIPDHLCSHARRSKERICSGELRTLAEASNRRKRHASLPQRPPISNAMTTKRHRRDCKSSWYVLSFLWRAISRATPSSRCARDLTVPSRATGETKVVSIASCAPRKRGSPLAITSNLRPSVAAIPSRLRSRRNAFVATLAPASLQMFAAVLSSGAPLAAKIPACGQAARWSP